METKEYTNRALDIIKALVKRNEKEYIDRTLDIIKALVTRNGIIANGKTVYIVDDEVLNGIDKEIETIREKLNIK